MTNLPQIDTEFMLQFLKELLNTPSPTGFTQAAVDLTENTLKNFPSLEIRRTNKGALVATWPGEKKATFPKSASAEKKLLSSFSKPVVYPFRLIRLKPCSTAPPLKSS